MEGVIGPPLGFPLVYKSNGPSNSDVYQQQRFHKNTSWIRSILTTLLQSTKYAQHFYKRSTPNTNNNASHTSKMSEQIEPREMDPTLVSVDEPAKDDDPVEDDDSVEDDDPLPDLTDDWQSLVQQCWSQPVAPGGLQVYHERPQPSDLRQALDAGYRFTIDGTPYVYSEELLNTMYRSFDRAWDASTVPGGTANSFLHAGPNMCFEIVTDIARNLRGIFATRDSTCSSKLGLCFLRNANGKRSVAAGQVILDEHPIFASPTRLPYRQMLLLPQKAIEAILFMQWSVDYTKFSDSQEAKPPHPHYRLLDTLMNIVISNIWIVPRTEDMFGTWLGILCLTGSLFRHTDAHNVGRYWDHDTDTVVYTLIRDVRAGQELTLSKVGHFEGHRAGIE